MDELAVVRGSCIDFGWHCPLSSCLSKWLYLWSFRFRNSLKNLIGIVDAFSKGGGGQKLPNLRRHSLWTAPNAISKKILFEQNQWKSMERVDNFWLTGLEWKTFYSLCHTLKYALSFYGAKMISDRPNHFGWVPIILDGPNLFWSGSNHFGQIQIIKTCL